MSRLTLLSCASTCPSSGVWSVVSFLVLKVVCVPCRGTCPRFPRSLLFQMASEKRLQYRQVLLPLVSRQVMFSTVPSCCSGHFPFRVSHYLSTCRAQGFVEYLWVHLHRMLIRCSAVLEEVLANALGLSPVEYQVSTVSVARASCFPMFDVTSCVLLVVVVPRNVRRLVAFAPRPTREQSHRVAHLRRDSHHTPSLTAQMATHDPLLGGARTRVSITLGTTVTSQFFSEL